MKGLLLAIAILANYGIAHGQELTFNSEFCAINLTAVSSTTARWVFPSSGTTHCALSSRANTFCVINLSTMSTEAVYISTFSTISNVKGFPCYGMLKECFTGPTVPVWVHQQAGKDWTNVQFLRLK